MRPIRNPRYAPEFLERKLSPSTVVDMGTTACYATATATATPTVDTSATSVDNGSTLLAPAPTDPTLMNPPTDPTLIAPDTAATDDSDDDDTEPLPPPLPGDPPIGPAGPAFSLPVS
jgi:hypothetical protein